MLALLPTLRPWLSLDGELRRYFQDPRVRLAFSFQSKYLGMSPFQCPSLFSILSFLEYEHGVWHPLGGCGAVSTAMACVARELGVVIRLDEAVTGIEFAGRRAVGVHTARQRYPADALVINADFAQAMTRLVPDRLRRRWTDGRIANKRFSCSTFMMYLGIDGRCDEVGHHTIYMARDFAGNLADIEQRHRHQSGDRLRQPIGGGRWFSRLRTLKNHEVRSISHSGHPRGDNPASIVQAGRSALQGDRTHVNASGTAGFSNPSRLSVRVHFGTDAPDRAREQAGSHPRQEPGSQGRQTPARRVQQA